MSDPLLTHVYAVTYLRPITCESERGPYGTRVRTIEAWTAADALTMLAVEMPECKPLKIEIPPRGSGAAGIDYSEEEWLEEVNS